MFGSKKRRGFNLKQYLMAFETPPTDGNDGGGGGTPPADPPAKKQDPPADPPAGSDDKKTATDLPADVKAQLDELTKLKAEKAKADEEAAKKKEAEELAKKSIEEQLEASKQKIAEMEHRQLVRDLRDKHGMTGSIYSRLVATVTEKDPEKAEAEMLAIKKEVDEAISAEVEKAKGNKAVGGGVSPTAGKPPSNAPKEPSGLYGKLFGSIGA